MAATTMMPLKDVTVSRLSMANTASNVSHKQLPFKPASQITPFQPTTTAMTVTAPPMPTVPQRTVRRNDPYNWEWRVPQPTQHDVLSLSPTPSLMNLLPSMSMSQSVSEVVGSPLAVMMPETSATFDAIPAPSNAVLCNVLVQFKCHHAEFSSEMELRKGQYVVVEGDRGVDIGVVIRINTDDNKQYVERTGPNGAVLRFATQREVDYWASDLKTDEAAALDYCKQRVAKHRLSMEVRHAEYQFDKKKLTFYYEAKSRVDFVTLLKELFREFSCRIWMEKVRMHE